MINASSALVSFIFYKSLWEYHFNKNKNSMGLEYIEIIIIKKHFHKSLLNIWLISSHALFVFVFCFFALATTDLISNHIRPEPHEPAL